jgi:hypothetical protein
MCMQKRGVRRATHDFGRKRMGKWTGHVLTAQYVLGTFMHMHRVL